MSDRPELLAALSSFRKEKNFLGQGPLCVALVVTQHARRSGLPLNADQLITEGGAGGQVVGLGRGAVQNILGRHGLTRILAKEGGRTSRGSLNNMRAYVALLNQLQERGLADIEAIEAFWIARAHDFFAGKPFRIKLDSSRSVRHIVRDVIAQAEERQRSAGGMYSAGAVMQHLIGAKLDCAMGKGEFTHNSFSTSDSQTGRSGDFLIGDVAIHVTTSPGEAVIERCRENLNDGLRAMLITLQRGLAVAEGLAGNAGLADRIDLFEIEQFIALNLYEMGRFSAAGRQTAVLALVERYNQIVNEVETDPSLRIEFR
ncbi:protein of unknown function [Granulicella rosea]|uniref:DUF4928 domain-containing protein n=1 Tax=Granulicella rosea TaxID=474952 RepID=A0A239DSJ5_9BACT|nr:DUF4928 family protein [Granulicella rosea]SNS34713.1 protein of unknown function [Granulicella rosea]